MSWSLVMLRSPCAGVVEVGGEFFDVFGDVFSWLECESCLDVWSLYAGGVADGEGDVRVFVARVVECDAGVFFWCAAGVGLEAGACLVCADADVVF